MHRSKMEHIALRGRNKRNFMYRHNIKHMYSWEEKARGISCTEDRFRYLITKGDMGVKHWWRFHTQKWNQSDAELNDKRKRNSTCRNKTWCELRRENKKKKPEWRMYWW
jgi:hypothetical protein